MKTIIIFIVALTISGCSSSTSYVATKVTHNNSYEDITTLNSRTAKCYKLSPQEVKDYTQKAEAGDGDAAYRLYFYYDTYIKDFDKSEYYHNLSLYLSCPMAYYNDAIMLIDGGGDPNMAHSSQQTAQKLGMKDTEFIIPQILEKLKELEDTARERRKKWEASNRPRGNDIILVTDFSSTTIETFNEFDTFRPHKDIAKSDIVVFSGMRPLRSYVYSKECVKQYAKRAAQGEGKYAYKLFCHYLYAHKWHTDEARYYYYLALKLKYPPALYQEAMNIIYKGGDPHKAEAYAAQALAMGEIDTCSLMLHAYTAARDEE